MIVQLMNESAGFAYRRVAALRPYLSFVAERFRFWTATS